MKFCSAADKLFAIVLVATIAAKVLVLRGDRPFNRDLISSRIEAVMRSGGMSIRTERNSEIGALVFGFKESCRMWARDYLPYGVRRDEYERLARGYGTLLFAYKGQVHDRPPKLAPLFRYYLARELQRAGLPSSRPPVIAMAASPGCKAQALAWSQVGEVPW